MGLTRIKAGQISDIDYKQAVRVVTITNVSLAGSAPATVDGVSLLSNDRVLVTGQNTASQNGLYRVQTLGTGSNGTWVRTTDANENGEIEAGMIVMVTEGSSYADTLWKLTTNNPIVIDSTELTFVLNSTGGGGVAGSNTQVQFNDNGSSGASTAFTFNKTANLLAVTGNIQGTYFIGNGSQLTGIAGGSGTAISNGTSNVNIATANANVTFSVNGMANRVVVGSTQTEFAGNVMPAANVTYDLGSSTNRWNDIWLANSTIYIGSANISADGADLVLPANVAIGSATLTAASGNLALPTGTTVGSALVETPRIANVQITTAAWVVKDDTAVALEGGYIIINGSGFVAGASVVVGSTLAAAATVVNSTTVRVQVNAAAAGTYVVYVANPDGSVGILVPGLTYSGTPTWVTGSTLPNQTTGVAVSVQLDATGATTYSVSAGNTLPEGLSLSSGGLLSGTVTVEAETVYNFSVDAIDAELQDSPRTFSVTITVGDPYFEYVTLLLHGNGTNGAQNNTFLDSSTNAFTITRNGNTTQGSFSPFSRADGKWSNYFDGSGDYLTVPSTSNLAFGTGDFCVEMWYYQNAQAAAGLFSNSFSSGGGDTQFEIQIAASTFYPTLIGWFTAFMTSNTASPARQWNHLVVCRNGTSMAMFLNGVRVATATSGNNFSYTGAFSIGVQAAGGLAFAGYISNLRAVKGSSVYDPSQSTLTIPTTPLTAIANTSLLTCQSNRFKDNSTNAFTITPNGNVSVQVFNPFNPTTAYSTTTNGGSGYFDGSGDYLTVPDNAAFDMGTGDFTLETWAYITSIPDTTGQAIFGDVNGYEWYMYSRSSGNLEVGMQTFAGGYSQIYTTNNYVKANQWAHIAVARQSGTLRIFVNGVQCTTTGSMSATLNISATINIARSNYNNTNFIYGYLSNLRVVKGTAVYTANFTPPTAPLTAISGTSFLMSCTNAGIFDNAAMNDLETVGNAQISTAQSKFGGGSMLFDGTDDRLVVPTSPNFAFGTGDFTIEQWVYPTNISINGGGGFFQTSTTVGGLVNNYSSGIVSVVGANGAGQNSSGGWFVSILGSYYGSAGSGAFTINTWHHVAITRSSGTLRGFINGTQIWTATNTGSIDGQNLVIGGYYSTAYLYQGYIDDFRITKGYARYTANFTPPTAPFQDL